MTEHVTAMDARQRLGELLDRVHLRHDAFVIERKGKPLAVLVPVQTLDRMRQAARAEVLDLLARQGEGMSEDAAIALADEAKHRSRHRD